MAGGTRRPDDDRPTGEALLGWGWFLITVGLFLGLMGLTMDATDYRGIDTEAFAMKLAALLAAAAFLNIGAFLAMGGIIVRALWFLPGRAWWETRAPFAPLAPSPAVEPPAFAAQPERPTEQPLPTAEPAASQLIHATEHDQPEVETRDGLDTLAKVIGIVGAILLALIAWVVAQELGWLEPRAH